MTTIRVLIADDQRLVREGLAVLVDAQPGIEVVGQAVYGAAAVDAAEELRPDIVLMDVRMPVLDGVAAAERLTVSGNSAKIIMLTTFDLDEYVYAALRAGASGFLLEDASASALAEAIRVVTRVRPCSRPRSPAGFWPRSPVARPATDRRSRRLRD